MKKFNRIVITGGSSGLGYELAEAFAKQGCKIAIVARDEKKLMSAALTLNKKYISSRVTSFSLDVTKYEGLADGFKKINEELGGIDLLINSAGILREGYFEKLTDTDFRSVMEINYFGALNSIRAALPFLRISKGQILNVASMAGLTGTFGYGPYSGSKYALMGISEVLRVELKPQGIKVQVVCPGEFDSPMVEELDKYRTPENKKHSQMIPRTPARVVVQGIMDGLQSSSFILLPGTITKISALLLRLFPNVSRYVVDKILGGIYVGPH